MTSLVTGEKEGVGGVRARPTKEVQDASMYLRNRQIERRNIIHLYNSNHIY